MRESRQGVEEGAGDTDEVVPLDMRCSAVRQCNAEPAPEECRHHPSSHADLASFGGETEWDICGCRFGEFVMMFLLPRHHLRFEALVHLISAHPQSRP